MTNYTTDGPWSSDSEFISSPDGFIAQLVERDTPRETEANGRLISSAPDLLIVLENLRGSIRHAATCKAPQAFPCSCDADQLWEMSGTAIAKARGGAA